jgi:transcriptional regulator GlxA family with amidase domain
MTNIPTDIQARREVEDRAIKLGEERLDLENREAANIEAVIDLIPEATDAGIPFDHLAKLVGVSRQTLYRWQEVARRLREGRQPG